MIPEKYQYYKGIKFTRDDDTGYYLNSNIRKRIHRFVWEENNGPIPDGYEIHHIDHDRSNNDVSNLQLLTADEHRRLHGKYMSENHYDVLVKRMDYARVYASKWHGSEAGSEWHRKHYEEMKDKLYVRTSKVCDYCGEEYQGTSNNRFCSNKCKSAWRRKAGLDNVDRICPICNKVFRTSKYSRTKTCSRTCGDESRKRTNKDKESTKSAAS